MKLRHYYHLYADGKYPWIVFDHFAALNAAGLINELDNLHVGFVGSSANVEKAQQLVAGLTPRPFTMNVASSGWEQETQDVLYRDAVDATEPFLALYAHTKGASSPSEMNDVWRAVMTLHTVRRWRTAIAAIKDNVGAAGCFWAPFENGRLLGITQGTPYFAGTFWWARSDAIAKIGPPHRVNRYGAEGWIGSVTTLPAPYEVSCLFDAPLSVPVLRRHLASVGHGR